MILFVDDEPRYAASYVEELQMTGYDVKYATNVDEALSVFTRVLGSIELLILDIMMPPGHNFKDVETVLGTRTGLFFFERVRLRKPDLAVVILTNSSDVEVSRFFKRQSHCWFLRKQDYDPLALAEVVSSIMSQ